jgi:hypothetical protein
MVSILLPSSGRSLLTDKINSARQGVCRVRFKPEMSDRVHPVLYKRLAAQAELAADRASTEPKNI